MNEKHVEFSLNKIRSIFSRTSECIEAIPVGEKIPATKLAEDLAKEIGMTGPGLYPTIKFLLDGYPDVKILKGAHGGILKLASGTSAASELPLVAPLNTNTVSE